MKKIHKHLTLYAGLVCFAISHQVIAEEVSPLSPNFILQPNQILSTTAIVHQKVDLEVRDLIAGVGLFKTGSITTGDIIGQSLKLGLPDNCEVGISESYSRAKTNQPQVSGVLDGLSNPTISAKKTWEPDADVLFNINLSAKPKTGNDELRGMPTTYNIGLATALTTPNGLVTTIGLNRLLVNGDSSTDSTAVQIGAYKEIGAYALNASAQLEVFDDQRRSASNPSLNSTLALTASLGHPITANTWLQLTYRHIDATFQTREIGAGDTLGASYTLNELGLLLKVLF